MSSYRSEKTQCLENAKLLEFNNTLAFSQEMGLICNTSTTMIKFKIPMKMKMKINIIDYSNMAKLSC